MKKIKLLFVILGEISSGELSMAMSFADDLDDTFESVFLTCNMHKKQLAGESRIFYFLNKIGTIEQNRNDFMFVIDKEKPDVLMLFDIFTFKYAQVWTGISIEMLKKLHIPMISIDEYNYADERTYIDYYGCEVRTNFTNLLKYCNITLTNCPLSSCRKLPMKNQLMYRLYNLNDFSNSNDNQIRKKYQFDNDKKIIFLATSYWEYAYFNEKVNILQKWMPLILGYYLNQIDEDITVVHVSSRKWKNLENISNITYVNFPVLNNQQFLEILKNSNLFITYNITSVTLTKAVLFRIPSLLLHNPKKINFVKFTEKISSYPDWFREMANEMKVADPFEASVFGWHNFLKPVLNDNEYINTFESSSVYNIAQSVDIIKRLLFDESIQKNLKQKQTEYIESYYEKLPSSNEVMKTACKMLEITK